MDGVALKRISDFEWASVSQYIIYISNVAGLVEINSNHVLFLHLARLGPDKVIKIKERALLLLKGNITKLTCFAGSFEDQLEASEMSVLRGMYRQFRSNVETVEGHIEIARAYQNCEGGQFDFSEEADGDLPY